MPPEEKKEEYTITFKNGALARLKKVARDLNISEDRLEDVIAKSVSLVDSAKEGHMITIKKGKEEYAVDLRHI